MIARFRAYLPYSLLVAEGENLEPIYFDYYGYGVTIYAPIQTLATDDITDLSAPLTFEQRIGQLDTPQTPSHVRGVTADGKPVTRINAIQIDFHRGEFSRRRPSNDEMAKGQPVLDPPIELVFEIAERYLSTIRVVSRAPWIRPLQEQQTLWRIQYLSDDGEMLPRDSEQYRLTATTDLRFSSYLLKSDVWRKIAELTPTYNPPAWETLLLDAIDALPQVGPALVLAHTALETLASHVLDHLARDSAVRPELWAWVVERRRRGQLRLEDQLDELLKAFTGKSLKPEPVLWRTYNQLREARNAYVHRGIATINSELVTAAKAGQLVGDTRDILTWLELLLPLELRSPHQMVDVRMNFQVLIEARRKPQ